MSLPPAKSTAPTPYVAGVQPILPGGDPTFTQNEFGRVSTALRATQRLTPAAAIAAPTPLVDGTVRLARYPWWPVSGQSADAWVYYDAYGPLWRFLGTAPTSSH